MDTGLRIITYGKGLIMKTLIKHANKKTYLPVLNTILVKDGIASATDIDHWIEYKTDKADGVYDAKGVKAGVWVKSDIPEQEWPVMGSHAFNGSVTVSIESLSFVALSTEETRYYLNGVFFDENGMVATDGHRLHQAKMQGAYNAKAILPKEAVNIILDCAKEEGVGEVTIYFGETKYSVDIGNYSIQGRLIDGNFPDYTRVIDGTKKHKHVAEFDYPTIKSMAKQAKAMHKANGGRKSPHVKIEGGNIEVMAGEFSQKWPINMRLDSAMGFNLEYLIDMHDVSGGDVYTHEPSDPMRIESGEYLTILMPIRI